METTKHISVTEQSQNVDLYINWPTDGEWRLSTEDAHWQVITKVCMFC